MSHLLDKVLDVDIDGHGRFKYILINVQDDVNNASKQIIRGYARAQWHDNIQHGPKVYIYRDDFRMDRDRFTKESTRNMSVKIGIDLLRSC